MTAKWEPVGPFRIERVEIEGDPVLDFLPKKSTYIAPDAFPANWEERIREIVREEIARAAAHSA